MSSRRTEGIGVTTINELTFQSKFLEPYLTYNDKTVSWDGSIFVYSDIANRKNDLIGRIPVQIKASTVAKYGGDTTSKPFEVADLINYNNDGGVMIFQIEFFGPTKNIYFASLLPFDLDLLLKDLKPGQQTKSVRLKQIRNTDTTELYNNCREFLIHRRRQFSLQPTVFPLDRIKEAIMEGICSIGDDLDRVLLSKPQYLYGKTHIDLSLYDCVTKINIEEISKTLSKPVSVRGKQYYPDYRVLRNRMSDTLFFGNNVVIRFQDGKINITVKISENLDDCTHDFDFVNKLIQDRAIQISGNNIVLLADGISDEEVQKFDTYYNYFRNVAALLDIFRISHGDLNIKAISDENAKALHFLIDTMVLNNPAPDLKGIPGKFRYIIGNLSILVLIHKNEHSKVEVSDLKNFTVNLIRDPEPGNQPSAQEVSAYLLLNADDMLCSNIRPFEIKDDIVMFKHTLEYDEKVNLLTLEMIKAYDKSTNKDFLVCANTLLDWLIAGKFSDENILQLNKLQITKRTRELNEKEIEYLHDLMAKMESNYLMLCGICLLINDAKGFQKNFDLLSDAERTDFVNFPIYSLLNTTIE